MTLEIAAHVVLSACSGPIGRSKSFLKLLLHSHWVQIAKAEHSSGLEKTVLRSVREHYLSIIELCFTSLCFTSLCFTSLHTRILAPSLT